MQIDLEKLTQFGALHIHHTHEWRSGHAEDPLVRFERMIEIMSDVTQRLTDSVSALALAVSNQGTALSDVATAIRNHPASTTDNGKLSVLADQIDSIASTISSSTSELQQLKVDEDAEDAGGPEESPADPTESGGTSDSTTGLSADQGSGSDTSTADNGGEQPPLGSSDGTSSANESAGTIEDRDASGDEQEAPTQPNQ